ncbi:MAG: acetylglutamate kinase [Balneolaceae bacterium]
MAKKDVSKQAKFLKLLSSSLSFRPDENNLEALQNQSVLIKAGGNALTNDKIKEEIVSQISFIRQSGGNPVIVHGGGIAIKQLLDDVGIRSEFVGGHRKTDARSMEYVEMALSGRVNKELVKLLNTAGLKAVGISGKDAGLVTAEKRYHTEKVDGTEKKTDLGHVGDVKNVDPSLIQSLISDGYVPVVSPVSAGEDGKDYNINADMFAGHLAGALKSEKFIALTDIDGLLKNVNDPGSIIHGLTAHQAESLFGTVIQGGMIPKIEACLIALTGGVKSAHIINGTKKETLLRCLLTKDKTGTTLIS